MTLGPMTKDKGLMTNDFKRARVAKLPDGNQIVFIKMADSAFYLELFQAAEESPIEPAKNDGYQFPAVRQIGFKVDNVDAKLAEMGEDAKISLGPFDFDDYMVGAQFGFMTPMGSSWKSAKDSRMRTIHQPSKRNFAQKKPGFFKRPGFS